MSYPRSALLNRPNLINDLSQVIQQNITARYSGGQSDFLSLRRSLEVLNAVIKEISSTKMMTGVKNMGQVRDCSFG